VPLKASLRRADAAQRSTLHVRHQHRTATATVTVAATARAGRSDAVTHAAADDVVHSAVVLDTVDASG
jgi:hypothetical protein